MHLRRFLLATFAVATTSAVALVPATADAAIAAPTAINARSFSLTTDMTSLSDEVAALHTALGARRRTVDYVMQNANRDRMPLCNGEAYSPVTSRSTVEGFCWNDGDDAVDYWYPQGITTTHDAYDAGQYDNHQIVLTSWYHKPENEGTGVPNKGVRVSFADWDADWPNKYRHVILVEPTAGGNFKAVPIHAGGIMWYGNLLYVVDTSLGIRVFDFERIYGVDTGRSTAIGRQSDGTYHAFDYAHVMVQVGWIRNSGASFRYSFISLDRASSPDSFVVGEYAPDADGNGVPDSSARVVRFPVDYTDRLPLEEADGKTYGSEAYDTHLPQMQGALARNGRFWFASSNGSSHGYLRVWDRGTSSVRSYRWAAGPEDLTYYAHPTDPDLIWTLTEYPNRRAVIAVPQASWD